MKTFVSLIFIILVAGLAGCAQPAAGAELKSDKPRITSPTVSGTDIATLVNGNSAFAFDLYQSMKNTQGNVFFSPYSISLALAMTYAGAKGDTEKQMAGTIHFSLPQSQLHPAFNSLQLDLATRGQGAQGKDEKGFRLHIVNAIWGQHGFPFLPAYLDTLAQNYGAGLRTVDFMKEPEPSRMLINQWVSDQTEQKIKDLIPQGVINDLTRLVLTNAIYFNAAWLYQFDKKATSDGDFQLLDGTKVTVPMMRQTKSFSYAESDTYQAVQLPYDGNELSMIVLLPRPGKFASFETSLNSQQVADIMKKMGNQQVALMMPKFQYESSFSLKKALGDLGMAAAFTSSADFSGMDGQRDLLIQDVLHKAYVAVDETGTEAAAATAVVVGVTSMPAQPIEVKIDHPFIFLIRDKASTILFMGRVVNPK